MLPKLFHPLRHLAWRNSRQRTIPRVKARHLTSDPHDLRQAIVHKDMVDPITDRYHTASTRFAFLREAREVWLGAFEPRLGLHTLILIVHASGAASHGRTNAGDEWVDALASARCKAVNGLSGFLFAARARKR